MATVDVYADDPNELAESAAPVWFNDSHVGLMLKLLPTGTAWPRDTDTTLYNFLLALSQTLMQCDRRGLDLLEEFDPNTTFELLSDWERVFGLPGACDTNPPTTLAGRRAAVLGKWLGFGDPTPALYESILTTNSVTGEIITNPPFVPGSPAGDPITEDEWAFAWIVSMVHGPSETAAQCQIQDIAPIHTIPVFEFIYSSWLAVDPDASFVGIFRAAAFNGTVWCIVGHTGEIQTSDDTNSFMQQTNAGSYAGTFADVASDDAGLLIAVGTGPEIQSSSNDGVTWVAETSAGATSRNAVAHDQSGLWLIGGTTGELETSPDGSAWTSRSNDGAYTGQINGVAHDGSALWVFVGASGEIQSSADAITWSAETAADSYSGSFQDVTYSDTLGLWCAVGTGATSEIQTSPDGSAWTKQTTPAGVTASLGTVTWGDGLFLAAGGTGDLISSPDGVTWTIESAGTSETIIGIEHSDNANEEGLIVGTTGLILVGKRTVYR